MAAAAEQEHQKVRHLALNTSPELPVMRFVFSLLISLWSTSVVVLSLP